MAVGTCEKERWKGESGVWFTMGGRREGGEKVGGINGVSSLRASIENCALCEFGQRTEGYHNESGGLGHITTAPAGLYKSRRAWVLRRVGGVVYGNII